MNYFQLCIILSFLAFLGSCRKDLPENLSGTSKTFKSNSEIISSSGVKLFVQSPGQNADIQPNLQAVINSASNGDEIVLPYGSFIFNKSIVTDKLLSIKGAGPGRTILYRSENISDQTLQNDWGGMFIFKATPASPNNIIISNIFFKSKKPSVTDGDGGSLATDFGIKFINAVDFIVTNCRFENFGRSAISVVHDDAISRALIYKNEFIHNTKGATGLGLGYGIEVYGTNNQWLSSPQFGSANFIFIEDNIFDYHRHAISAGGAARYVFRYNTVKNNLFSHAVDSHEARKVPGTNYYSTRAAEIYNNVIINSTFKDGSSLISPGQSSTLLTEAAIRIRGGEALIYNNTISGFRFGVGIINFEVSGVQNYPIFTQIGYRSGFTYGVNHTGTSSSPGDGDLFIWNNSFTKYEGTQSSMFFYNYQPEYFKEDRDYHFVPKPKYVPYIYPHPGRIVN